MPFAPIASLSDYSQAPTDGLQRANRSACKTGRHRVHSSWQLGRVLRHRYRQQAEMGRRIARQQFQGNRRFQQHNESLGGQPDRAVLERSNRPGDPGTSDPATKVDLNAANATNGNMIFNRIPGTGSGIASSGRAGAIDLQNGAHSGQAAAVTFERGGSIFVNFGLDTDNVLKVGGGNLGANAYPVIHAGNYNNYINQALVQVGTWRSRFHGIFAVLDNAAPTATVQPGVAVDGSILIYSSCAANYNSGQRPAGTWRCPWAM
ncbi:tail protein [Pseudomonas phage WP1]